MKNCVRKWLEEQLRGMDASMAETIYSEYVATVTRLFAELATARMAGASAEAKISHLAHTLKGSASMVGDVSLHDAVARWRDAFKTGNLTKAERLWSTVEREVKANG